MEDGTSWPYGLVLESTVRRLRGTHICSCNKGSLLMTLAYVSPGGKNSLCLVYFFFALAKTRDQTAPICCQALPTPSPQVRGPMDMGSFPQVAFPRNRELHDHRAPSLMLPHNDRKNCANPCSCFMSVLSAALAEFLTPLRDPPVTRGTFITKPSG